MSGIVRIPLTRGLFAVVDEHVAPLLLSHSWQAVKMHGLLYARRTDGKLSIFMHRQILGLSRGDGLLVDHADGDGLNNRKSNLRLCNRSTNGANAKPRANRSGFKGVVPTRWGKWEAQIKVNQQHIGLGHFRHKEEAALAYDQAARVHFGEFARCNYPDES